MLNNINLKDQMKMWLDWQRMFTLV